MTEQYSKSNINNTAAPRFLTGATAFTLTSDDEFVTVDTGAGATTVTLPLASAAPGQQVTIQC